MPAHDYGDLSRLALEADLDELRARLARMSDRAAARIRVRRGLHVHAVREPREAHTFASRTDHDRAAVEIRSLLPLADEVVLAYCGSPVPSATRCLTYSSRESAGTRRSSSALRSTSGSGRRSRPSSESKSKA